MEGPTLLNMYSKKLPMGRRGRQEQDMLGYPEICVQIQGQWRTWCERH